MVQKNNYLCKKRLDFIHECKRKKSNTKIKVEKTNLLFKIKEGWYDKNDKDFKENEKTIKRLSLDRIGNIYAGGPNDGGPSFDRDECR